MKSNIYIISTPVSIHSFFNYSRLLLGELGIEQFNTLSLMGVDLSRVPTFNMFKNIFPKSKHLYTETPFILFPGFKCCH